MEATLYSLLEVPIDADSVAIALAYARRLHLPEPGAQRATLTYAFLVLSDPQRRAAYDAALGQHSARAELERRAAESENCSFNLNEDGGRGQEGKDKCGSFQR